MSATDLPVALEHAPDRKRLTIKDLHAWHERLMRHVPPPPEHVPALMKDLVAFANAHGPMRSPRRQSRTRKFETIYPYGDGSVRA